jgi:hypothetical protein
MTEAEWLTCTDPEPMLEFLRGKASERKLRLFACACTRLLWDRLPAGVMRDAVEAGERHADGLPWEEECQRLVHQLYTLVVQGWLKDQTEETIFAWRGAVTSVSHWVGLSRIPGNPTWREHSKATGRQQPGLLRDIFGNPFRPAAFNPAWRTPDVVTLAGHVYYDRAFGELPTLADALEEARCTDVELLGHLRGPGPHVRGCWAVDLILAKG